MYSKALFLRVFKARDGVSRGEIYSFNSLPNDKTLDWPKFKAFAEDKIHVTQKLKFSFGMVENFVGKEENAGYQHFLLFPQCFQKASFTGSLKVRIVL